MSEMNYELIEQVKRAAKEGAREGAREASRRRSFNLYNVSSLFKSIVAAVVLIAVLIAAWYFLDTKNRLAEQKGRESSAQEHDLVLEDHGVFGYTAADFADAVLGDQSKLCKLQVLKQEVSELSTVTDTGLGNFKIFSKNQLITYHGTAIYTVDLSKLKKSDFVLDEDKKELTIYIPHTVLEPINIQSSDIEFGDVNRGLLAFGDINATPQQIAAVQSKAQEMMEKKIAKQNIAEDADRFAKLVVWELFQPVVNSVSKGYSLVVDFK